MKSRLTAFTSAGLFGLCLLATGTNAAHAQSSTQNLRRITEDTFIRIPALEFTVASVDLDHYLAGVPLDFTRTERALSQVRPGLGYNDGMVWLTFKIGGKRGLLSQIRNFRLTKRSRSTWRLASGPRYDFAQAAVPTSHAFASGAARHDNVPTPTQRPITREAQSSQVAMSASAPGILTVDRHSVIR